MHFTRACLDHAWTRSSLEGMISAGRGVRRDSDARPILRPNKRHTEGLVAHARFRQTNNKRIKKTTLSLTHTAKEKENALMFQYAVTATPCCMHFRTYMHNMHMAALPRLPAPRLAHLTRPSPPRHHPFLGSSPGPSRAPPRSRRGSRPSGSACGSRASPRAAATTPRSGW